MLDRDRCRLYELYKARRQDGGKRWRAGSGAIWNLRVNHFRPRGWTSADAAGLPILPGLVRYDEVKRGEIDHAIRFTAEPLHHSYVYPASHSDGRTSSRRAPPMGSRFRLRAGFDTSGFPPQSRIILEALKRHGMILADSGQQWSLIGAPSGGWDDEDLESLQQDARDATSRSSTPAACPSQGDSRSPEYPSNPPGRRRARLYAGRDARQACTRRRSRARPAGDGCARVRTPAARRAELSGVPEGQRLEQARRQAAGGVRTPPRWSAASASAPTSTLTSVPGPGRERRSGSRT